MANTIQWIIGLISFVGAVLLIPIIQGFITPMIPNIYLVYAAVYLIAFFLSALIFPKILAYAYIKSQENKPRR